MAGEEKWWSLKGVLKDMFLAKVILPIVVVAILIVLAVSGATG